MRVETAIGHQIARLRQARRMSLTQLGEAVGRYLDKPWSRQAVHQAEQGRRAFTAAEPVELPGATVSAEDYQGILLYAGSDAPRDGIDELLVALRDIEQILARPALARLAKIERVAQQVAGQARTA